MPAGSPFTLLCQNLAGHHDSGRADLHLHSVYSDGAYTPEEIVQHALKAGLTAIAITDHDTLSGYRPTQQAALRAGRTLEVIPAVEITCEYDSREVHLLAYFIYPEDPALLQSLEYLRQTRLERFLAMAKRLQGLGLSIDVESSLKHLLDGATLGRRHLAKILLETRQVRSIFEAFTRYLSDPVLNAIPKGRIPIADAIAIVKNAGGISSWAHPPLDATMTQIRELQGLGLDALECIYPWSKPTHGKRLRAMAEELGLGISGGSDCHGPQPNTRAIGSRAIKRSDLARLRALVR